MIVKVFRLQSARMNSMTEIKVLTHVLRDACLSASATLNPLTTPLDQGFLTVYYLNFPCHSPSNRPLSACHSPWIRFRPSERTSGKSSTAHDFIYFPRAFPSMSRSRLTIPVHSAQWTPFAAKTQQMIKEQLGQADEKA